MQPPPPTPTSRRWASGTVPRHGIALRRRRPAGRRIAPDEPSGALENGGLGA
ncbi:hypothetical protein HRK28_01120 [Rathayibacter sp. VKM Ac-2835]|uniref:hypothetical protein n=1 Tax=Rathayibacter sp. VKM Ac-2835 TaxID=2739043 RepID=UPI001565D995|nr:hypothetical protein [Rathayibacter sp. VKM Ac-2835]NRG39510.1 hypothetical protein [Rathayibacter sp. VKM Ac-2835]